MIPASPAEALGRHTDVVRSFVVDPIVDLHKRFAHAHEVSGTEHGDLFGAQWRDLLKAVAGEAASRGYRTRRVPPGGNRLPVVNNCLLHPWRLPGSARSVSNFASSSTRKNSFAAPMVDDVLFEPGYDGESEETPSWLKNIELRHLTEGATTLVMPLVLVMVHSTPHQLRAIEWAVAEYDRESDEVQLHGQETIWEPEPVAEETDGAVESFDSGVPAGPQLEPLEQEGGRPDA